MNKIRRAEARNVSGLLVYIAAVQAMWNQMRDAFQTLGALRQLDRMKAVVVRKVSEMTERVNIENFAAAVDGDLLVHLLSSSNPVVREVALESAIFGSHSRLSVYDFERVLNSVIESGTWKREMLLPVMDRLIAFNAVRLYEPAPLTFWDFWLRLPGGAEALIGALSSPDVSRVTMVAKCLSSAFWVVQCAFQSQRRAHFRDDPPCHEDVIGGKSWAVDDVRRHNIDAVRTYRSWRRSIARHLPEIANALLGRQDPELDAEFWHLYLEVARDPCEVTSRAVIDIWPDIYEFEDGRMGTNWIIAEGFKAAKAAFEQSCERAACA